MDRRPAGRRRASVGFITVAVAAILLLLALWQVFALNTAAGGDVLRLGRERVAVQYQRLLMPVLLDANRFRAQLRETGAKPDPALRTRIDSQMSNLNRFTLAHEEFLDIVPEWQRTYDMWREARNAPPGDPTDAVGRFVHALAVNVIYKVEDTSGLEYENSRIAQDLADITFAKLPLAVNDAAYAAVLSSNAQSAQSISIPDRIALARLLHDLSPVEGNWDLDADDWNDLVLPQLLRMNAISPADADRYRAQDAALVSAATALLSNESRDVLMRERPLGDPAATRANASRAIRASALMESDLSDALERHLTLRTRFEASRNVYLYGIVLLGALLIVGVMLMVAEVSSRREREALVRAQQESERLSAELARQKAERALHVSEAQFRALFDGAAIGIGMLNPDGGILEANTLFRKIYGDSSTALLEAQGAQFEELMRGEREFFEFEQNVLTPGGHDAWSHVTISRVDDESGKPHCAVCVFRDLTDLKRSERRMVHGLTHDELTGLANRSLFESKVREQFLRRYASPDASFAVLFVDLDRFKDINESLGHDSGDFVISQVAHRLQAASEGTDIVARLGSDEFAILVCSLSGVLHVEAVARRVLTALSKPVTLRNRSIFVPASVGIAVASAKHQRPEDVLRDADIAMHHAKGGGGSRYAIFDSRMHARAEKRLQLTTDLRLGVERGEFNLLYQPIVNIADDSLVGCEALLRWNHPKEGVVGPSEFIPLAEQTGLAPLIGRFVLRTVCNQAARWKSSRDRRAGFPINVNVSARELLDGEFESVLLGAVRDASVEPRDLMLEITESAVLDSGTRPNALVDRLRNYGFGICIDDFGTGYSSLRYLQQFKVDAIKIDRSFVAGQDGNVASEPIVRTLMSLAEAFNVRVVAEGIETPRQRDVLQSAGCRYGQGYYYATALAASDISAMYPSAFGGSARHTA